LTESGSDISMIPYGEAYGEGFEDMYRRVPDIAKVQALIGWTPTRVLDDIIGDVVTHQRGAATVAHPLPAVASAVGERPA
jgi:UDP-glucose 4-epimerase